MEIGQRREVDCLDETRQLGDVLLLQRRSEGHGGSAGPSINLLPQLALAFNRDRPRGEIHRKSRDVAYSQPRHRNRFSSELDAGTGSSREATREFAWYGASGWRREEGRLLRRRRHARRGVRGYAWGAPRAVPARALAGRRGPRLSTPVFPPAQRLGNQPRVAEPPRVARRARGPSAALPCWAARAQPGWVTWRGWPARPCAQDILESFSVRMRSRATSGTGMPLTEVSRLRRRACCWRKAAR